ncbi:MAG: hypothetical protein AAF840_05405 [Bacteroidota bacterium]
MKTSSLTFLLLLCIGLLGWSACGDDDDLVLDSLNYDGPNFTAPQNGPGVNTFAAFFPESEVQPFIGRELNRVSFWLERVPLATSVVVFAASIDDRTPGAELYRIDLTQRIRSTGWVEHNLTTPIELTGTGIWIAVETDVELVGDQAIGCDEGLNYNPNGDRFLPSGSTVWTSFNEITSSERINWNIRGFLAPVE